MRYTEGFKKSLVRRMLLADAPSVSGLTPEEEGEWLRRKGLLDTVTIIRRQAMHEAECAMRNLLYNNIYN